MKDSQPSDSREPLASNDQEISLAPLFATAWHYRLVIAGGLVATFVVYGLAVLYFVLTLPSERVARISFRVEMEGAAMGQYPNGARFSPADIVATPVLTQVYESNGLRAYSSFNDFASAILIENWNLKRDALAAEYEAKLADAKLTPVDRARLEDEYQNELRALNTPEFRLSFRRREGVVQMPEVLLVKVLEDTLATWARQADDRKGALRYNMPVLSGNILNWDAIAGEDYLIGIDILRGKVIRILENIGPGKGHTLSTLPGASAIRSGPNKLSLAEVRVVLEDLLRFKIEPLLGFARSNGLSKQPALLRVYIDNQLFQMRLKTEEANRNALAVEQSLSQYATQRTRSASGGQNVPLPGVSRQQGSDTPAMIPQFSESFLDRLVEMSSRSDDVGYRQRLTDQLIAARLESARLATESSYYESLRLVGTRPSGVPDEMQKVLEERLKEAFNDVAWALQHVTAIYDQLSRNNLNPSTMLYTVTMPFTQRRLASVSIRYFALWGVLMLSAAFIALVGGVLAYHYLNRRPVVAPPAPVT